MNIPERKSRRWNVIGSGLLCAAFAVVVLYTSPRAFFSPLALVVVAAIGLAAVLLQLRVRHDAERRTRGPVWLNLLGILLALAALFSDVLHLSSGLFQVAALAAVGCFSISSVIIMEALRKHRVVPK